ncbi:MAG: glutamate-1-semialdehyde-2,1-aminomutase [Bacteroidetes bacterium RIFCSPLOWO2_02_FULL_36_8]|nr:MAG: glutamate-1-semialdehyde-2,1-aminomutase [Bacteroidetes bacterium RIFCSPLOWO2_02_FULL_36_8]OFY69629.1 MAG: glutamate-1-semialdehyde-2,1-aminomutase [Bacteroidetes bacterium RIFCSPLOWO2_12_FULL_37_12]
MKKLFLSLNNKLFKRAIGYIPGGVNSPVRAFKAVGGTPVFIKSAKGAFLYDHEGKSYIDLINSWGPMILGHAHPSVVKAIKSAVDKSFSFGTPTEGEVQLAELICEMVPSIEKVRLVNSGTEACMSAIRLARAFTGKNKIIKFEGCYHGHADSFLVSAGSGALTQGVPDSPGVTSSVVSDTLVARYNNLKSVNQLVEKERGQLAAIIVEPVAGNMGVVLPEKGFLEGLRKICDCEKIILIFDEVMTGFRLAEGGVQSLVGIKPDLTTLGKIIGGGMPVGAYGGKAELMNLISPAGPVYQAGTLSGNPITVAAGLATLNYLKKHPEIYGKLNETTKKITLALERIFSMNGISVTINSIGSMFTVFFNKNAVTDLYSAKQSDTKLFSNYFHLLLSKGIHIAPSCFESLFVSMAITENISKKIIGIHEEIVPELR